MGIPCVWVLNVSTLEVLVWEHDDTEINALNPLHGMLGQAMFVRHAHIEVSA